MADYSNEVRPIEDIKSSYQLDGLTYYQYVLLELFLVLSYKFDKYEEILNVPP